MTTTLEQIRLFRLNAAAWLKTEKNFTVLRYAVEKMIKKTASAEKKYQADMEDLRAQFSAKKKVENQSVFILSENGQRSFTEDGEKKLKEKELQLLSENIEIEPHVVSKDEIPVTMSMQLIEIFTPFVFEPFASQEDEEEWYLSRGKKKEDKIQE